MMKHSSVIVATAAILTASAGAWAQNAGSAGKASQPGSSAASQAQSTRNASRKVYKRLAGEWEGQVQIMGDGGMTSASIISASNRLESDGNALASCLSGFAFGQELQAAAIFSVRESAASASWIDSRSKSPMSVAGVEASDGALRFRGHAPAAKGAKDDKPSQLEQVVQIPDDDHYTVELYRTAADGKRVCMVRLDMSRMAKGQVASASERFSSSPLLSTLRSSATTRAQASAEKNE